MAPAANMLGTSQFPFACMIWQHAVILKSICEIKSVIIFLPAQRTGLLTPVLTCSPLFFSLLLPVLFLCPTSLSALYSLDNFFQVQLSLLRKRQQWSYTKRRNKVTWDRNCFIFYFYSDKLSHYKTYDFRKCPIPDVFKRVWLQNTFNRCKVYL